MGVFSIFPIDNTYNELKVSDFDDDSIETLKKNIGFCRDSIVFFTALANKKGLGGHTGGAYDVVPETMIIRSMMKADDSIYPVFFDEAGHRVALQYLLAALDGKISFEDLMKYRQHGAGLYGHPERDDKRGINFSSGRLGHMWSMVNGISLANKDKSIVMLGSDGSQQEGCDAEAARFCVANNLNVKLIIDDNDVTIAGHPSEYMKGYDVSKTLQGHGMKTKTVDGENLKELIQGIKDIFNEKGAHALIVKRKMAPGIKGIEGEPKGHDVVPVEYAIDYLKGKGHERAIEVLEKEEKLSMDYEFLASSKEKNKNRDQFGKIIADMLDDEEKKKNTFVIDSDLEGSCGLHHIRKKHPECYIKGGIMERNNMGAAAGFGFGDKQAIFATFAAFQEMVISEITMARLNDCNMICHFSHSGVDDMADNTCHFGINNFFSDNGIMENDNTRLYFPADALQMEKVLKKIFDEKGIRFVYSTRSATPFILDENGDKFFNDEYEFNGSDEVIRYSDDAYIISYGEMLYRCLDAIERLRKEGIDIGLINKPLLNIQDEKMLKELASKKYVMVVETQNKKTGLGIRFGTWLLENGFKGKYEHMGITKLGQGGLFEQIPYQGLGPKDIIRKVKSRLGQGQLSH